MPSLHTQEVLRNELLPHFRIVDLRCSPPPPENPARGGADFLLPWCFSIASDKLGGSKPLGGGAVSLAGVLSSSHSFLPSSAEARCVLGLLFPPPSLDLCV
ncbi:UNVERIFIED_CONTAM: hypothetical protein K2H54_073969 [Gekko kuhli]